MFIHIFFSVLNDITNTIQDKIYKIFRDHATGLHSRRCSKSKRVSILIFFNIVSRCTIKISHLVGTETHKYYPRYFITHFKIF